MSVNWPFGIKSIRYTWKSKNFKWGCPKQKLRQPLLGKNPVVIWCWKLRIDGVLKTHWARASCVLNGDLHFIKVWLINISIHIDMWHHSWYFQSIAVSCYTCMDYRFIYRFIYTHWYIGDHRSDHYWLMLNIQKN